jgi:hypothetical protein
MQAQRRNRRRVQHRPRGGQHGIMIIFAIVVAIYFGTEVYDDAAKEYKTDSEHEIDYLKEVEVACKGASSGTTADK